jgi:exopolyphosphatase / guanosine-5'-triphosphate,3'-diphosphate pyrophosphatase
MLIIGRVPRYAAIDIGSNSVKMLAAEVTPNEELVTLAEDREVTRLGASVFETGTISNEAMETVCLVLARMARRYQQLQVLAVRAVATSAVRDASNQRLFLDRASAAIGAPVEVISGLEEARLIQLGVMTRWPQPEGRTLLIDIGGGSAEVICTEGGKLWEAISKPIGAVRLTSMFLSADPPTKAGLASMDEYIAERMAPAVSRFSRLKVDRVVATAGTAAAVVRAARGITSTARDAADRQSATLPQIRRLYKDLSGMKLAKRRRVPGIGTRRAEIIVPGLAVLRYALEAFGQTSLVHSTAGLRDGIIADLWHRRAGADQTRLDRDQRRQVEQLATRFGVHLPSARKMSSFAQRLFVSLFTLHRLPPAHGKLLEASAYLCDAGHFISDTGHHKHSEYIVINAELPGFTSAERRMVATLVRFHRKSMPAARHLAFNALPAEDRRAAQLLIPLLRLAAALDHSPPTKANHRAGVTDFSCQVRNLGVTLELQARGEVDLEHWASEQVAAIFEQAYGHSLTVTIA